MELTKKELVAKIEEQGHLAEAVRAKDLEIVQLKKEIEILTKNLHAVQSDANAKVQKSQSEAAEKISEIKKQKQTELESAYKSEIENLKNVIVQYQEANKNLVANANKHLTTFRNLVNVMNGALNMATDIDELISPKKE